MSNNLVPFSDIQNMAVAVAKSGLFGMKTPEQAIALMLVAQSEGLHPARAAMEYHVIQGRPALKADAMLARFQNAGGKVDWIKYTDAEVSGEFSHPSGGSVVITWTLEQATKAGLTKNPTWKQYPRAMLRARCISEGIRTVYPGVSVGIYTPEEVADFAPPEKDITPVVTPMPEKVKAAAKAVIEGKARTITGNPDEGDLSHVGTPEPADAAAIDKVLNAFLAIGLVEKEVEQLVGKASPDWMQSDIVVARAKYKSTKAEIDARHAAEDAEENGVL